MTVIAFDGKTLAADRQSTSNGHTSTCRKILRCADGSLIAAAGHATHAMQLLRWACEGFVEAQFPVWADKENYADLWRVLPDGKILCYENGPEPLRYLDATFVAGHGRGYAAGAMAMGATAERAVEVACQLDAFCGGGVDTLELKLEEVL